MPILREGISSRLQMQTIQLVPMSDPGRLVQTLFPFRDECVLSEHLSLHLQNVHKPAAVTVHMSRLKISFGGTVCPLSLWSRWISYTASLLMALASAKVIWDIHTLSLHPSCTQFAQMWPLPRKSSLWPTCP